jgi:hypothetical protein
MDRREFEYSRVVTGVLTVASQLLPAQSQVHFSSDARFTESPVRAAGAAQQKDTPCKIASISWRAAR